MTTAQSKLQDEETNDKDNKKEVTLEQRVMKLIFSENAFLILRLALLGILGKFLHSVYKRKDLLLPYLTYYWDVVKNNPFLMAIFGGSIIATPAAIVRYIVNPIWAYIRSFFVSRIVIESSDPSFLKVRDYIMEQPHYGVAADTNLKAQTKKKQMQWKQWRAIWAGTAMQRIPEMTYASESGQAIYINYENTQLAVYIYKYGKPEVVGHRRQLMQPYKIDITAMGREGVNVIKKFIVDALRNDLKLDESDTTNIFVSSDSWMGNWEKAMEKKKRDKTTVVLDEDLSDKLVKDAKNFLSSSEWYAQRGIPYRRGYLLYGPPGTGKTSFCQVLAGELDADLCLLTLTDSDLTDTRLAASMREAPAGSIILLEDVDAVFVERQSADEKKKSNGVSFSGLLNAIDGVASQEGRIFIMTTNHIEKLDPALKRPGRCDVTAKLDYASRSQMIRLFTRFYAKSNDDSSTSDNKKIFSMKELARNNGSSATASSTTKMNSEEAAPKEVISPQLMELGKKFSMMLPELELSMAKLSGYLMKWENPEDAVQVKNIQELLHVSQEKQIFINRSIYDHFRRVGLEHLTPYFEANNYRFQHDLKRLDDVNKCKSWCWELNNDDRTFNRLKLLLKNNNSEMKEEYQRATIATIRDAFLAQFSENRMIKTDTDVFDRICDKKKVMGKKMRPTLRRLNTDELKDPTYILVNDKASNVDNSSGDEEEGIRSKNNSIRNEFVAMEVSKQLQSMAQDFVEVVSKNGRVEISLWQLRWLLSQFDNPDDLIYAARKMCDPRPLSSFQIEPLKTRTWLKWIGLTKYLHQFEKKGGMKDYASVKENLSKDDSVLRKICIPPDDIAFIMKVVRNKPETRSQTVGILRPYKSHVANLFWSHYADKIKNDSKSSKKVKNIAENKNSSEKLISSTMNNKKKLIEAASYFSKMVCDEYGRSTVSIIEIKKYFMENNENFEDALRNCKQTLLQLQVPEEEKPRPASRPPAHWVYKVLRNMDGNMEDTIAGVLEGADIKTKDDLLAKPSLSLEEMKSIGIDKLGIAKRLFRLISKLQIAEEEDELLRTDDGDEDEDSVHDEDSNDYYENVGANDILNSSPTYVTKRLNKISGIPSKDDYIKTPYGIGRVMEFIEDSDMYKIKLAFGIVFVSDAESKVTNYFKRFIKEDQDKNNNNKILSSPSTKK